jgi:hypothetical protein
MSFFQQNGFDVFISLNGINIDRSQICDQITVSKSKNQATLAEFTLFNGSGIQTPDEFVGASITIDVRTSAGIKRIFTGIVELPELDLIDKKTKYKCTDNRENKIKELPLGYIEGIGSYSTAIFGEIGDSAETLAKRLTTVEAYFGFDSYGNPLYKSWTPKASPDSLFTDSSIYYERPDVRYSPRSKIVNSINMQITYGYQRCHQKQINYFWSGDIAPGQGIIQWFQGGRPSFPTIEGIRSAAMGVGWQVQNINLTPLPPAEIIAYNGGVLIWSPDSVDTTYGIKTDSAGNTVKDSAGNPVYEVTTRTITDASSHLCAGASWTAYKKFTQNVQEQYSIVVASPQSIDKYGVNQTNETYTLKTEYDPQQWENTPIVSNLSTTAFIDQDSTRYELAAALNTALNKAKTELVANHRDVEVNFQTFINNDVELYDTIELDAYKVECKGIATYVTHTIDVASREARTGVTIELSRMSGTTTPTSLVVPSRPSEDTGYTAFTTSIFLQSTYGADPRLYPGRNGYFGNIWINGTENTLGYRTEAPEAFVVDAPAIPEAIRGNRSLYKEADYNVLIPNNTLVVRF